MGVGRLWGFQSPEVGCWDIQGSREWGNIFFSDIECPVITLIHAQVSNWVPKKTKNRREGEDRLREEEGHGEWVGTRESIGVNMAKIHYVAYENDKTQFYALCFIKVKCKIFPMLKLAHTIGDSPSAPLNGLPNPFFLPQAKALSKVHACP